MTGGTFDSETAGGPVRHIPVMLNEVLDCLQPTAGSIFVDGTFGAGGYSRAILSTGAQVVGIDRDPDAIAGAALLQQDYPHTFTISQGEFGELDRLASEAGYPSVDGVVLDIGVSSMQFDEAERGFSFQNDGPLDMRMSQTGVSAADVVNQIPQQDLTRIIGILGEEKKASLISREIVRAREREPITTTLQLSSVIQSVVHRKASDKIHPATRTFQALRIFVNRELEQLSKALFAAERLLKTGGRLVVVTFHSLEDRVVKQFFRDRSSTQQGSRHLPSVDRKAVNFEVIGNGLLIPKREEADLNPRARSAKLRWGIRTANVAGNADFSIFGFPNLVPLSGFRAGGTV